MVDPFYQKVQGANVQAPVQPQEFQQAQAQLQIQQIQQQQTLLQQQYNQLGVVFQNPQTPAAQKQQVQAQMQQLSTQYQQNTQALQQLWVWWNHVTKPTDAQITTSGSKISMKWFMLGCAVLFIFLVGWFVGVFYYLMQNPSQWSSVGLDPATIKTLLQTFATIFFWLLVFTGIAMIIVNAYRWVSSKNTSKVRNIIGTIFGIILFIGSIALWSNVLTTIRNMSWGSALDANKIVIPYVLQVAWAITNWIPLQSDPTIRLIAPSSISYVLNSAYFTSQIWNTLWQVTFTDMTLDCGNWQTLSINMSTSQFVWSCMYFKKGNYTLWLLVSYINIPTWEKLQKSFSGWMMTFDSEITLMTSEWELTHNDSNTEMIAGKVPSKVTFDATSVFRDFNLPEYKVLWDVNGDGEMDRQDATSFTFVYTWAKLYTVNVRFPGLNNFIYTFPLRIEQSDVPVCEVSSTLLTATNYKISTSFYDPNVLIDQYEFVILDTKNNSVFETLKNSNGTFDYQFPWAWTYAVKTIFLTPEGKQWTCESPDIQVGAADFTVAYDLKYKSPLSPTFKSFGAETGVYVTGSVINIREIPTIIQLSVSSIVPNSPTVEKKILLDGKPILSSDGKTFEIKIDTNADHQITLVVQDPARGTKSEQSLMVKVNRDDIIGKLIVKPSTVGIDPFTVTFDASTTTLNDPTDEIVYFSWDFGDGEIRKNLSQSIMTHTYRYDTKNEDGEYTPVVTIKTKKGREISLSPESNIIVKKALVSLKINIDSHPAQLAMVGDRVSFSLQINGVPTTIQRDFANGKTLECKWRECVQATTSYDTAGDYTIKVKVTYPDQPVVEWNIVLKVK